MTAVSTIISRSLRLLGALDPNESLRAEDMVTARIALNAMVARWEANGLALGWSAVDDPEAAIPCPVEAEDAIAYNLACKLAPEYQIEPRGDVVTDARSLLADLRRDCLVSRPLRQCSDLPTSHGIWNITTDEPV